jgi:hypothetical protein
MKTMKKTTMMKLATTVVAVFFAVAVMAQGTQPPGTPAVTYVADGSTYMTEGTSIPLYALPDSYYHPLYNPASNWTLTADFTWIWTEVTTTLSFSQNNVNDNYVVLSAPAASAGVYTVNVLERAPAAFGGCDDVNGQNITINVVTAPSVDFGGNQTVSLCAGDAGLPASINATIAGGWQNYRFTWNLEIHTLDAGNNIDFYYDDENGTNPAAAPKFATEFTAAAPQAVGAAGNVNIMTVIDFLVIDGKRTVYTYTLTGINDQASRFGDFIALNGVDANPAAFTYYAASETYTVTVLPAPSTGPIFHIPAAWAQ